LGPFGQPKDSTDSDQTKRVHLLDHPLSQHNLTVLRDKFSTAHQLRISSNQLLSALILEATRRLSTRTISYRGEHGEFQGRSVDKSVIFVSVAKHGLGLSHNVSELIPDVSVGTIAFEHSATNRLEARLNLTRATALHDSLVILFDPSVGSGFSATAALHLLKRSGATELAVVSFVLSLPGLNRIHAALPDVNIFAAAIDEDLDPKTGPVPGIGNIAERLYR
jgi:uracil phosphoribosyltransferase